MAFVSSGSAGLWRWFPWVLVAAFAVIFAVNGSLVYFALHTMPGVVSEHPFELGNGYNDVLAQGAAQDALGWHANVTLARGDLRVTFQDRAGQSLTGLAVSARIIRPVEDLPVIAVTLLAKRPGLYGAPLALPRPGQWEVQVTATRDRQVYRFRQRVEAP